MRQVSRVNTGDAGLLDLTNIEIFEKRAFSVNAFGHIFTSLVQQFRVDNIFENNSFF